ncbi:MAG TPA: hypothetical protein VF463_20075 [Sphingobium sp.]
MTGQSRAEATASDNMGYAGWVLLGGGLLIVAGGAAFAMTRRPKRREEVAAYSVPVAPILPAPPMARQPETFTAPHVGREEPHRASIASPGPTAHGGIHEDRHAVLEALVAEAPSQANPFHSRRNRLRRADFLLRTGQVQEQTSANMRHAYEEPTLVSDRWSEMRMGGKQNARVSWKPATQR